VTHVDALPVIFGLTMFRLLGSTASIAPIGSCAFANTLVTVITAILQSTPFLMTVIYAGILINLHKHLVHAQQQQLQQLNEPTQSQQLATVVGPSRTIMPLVIFTVLASFVAHLLIVFGCTGMFGASSNPPTTTAMIMGQVIQLCTALTMLVCGIVMFIRVNASCAHMKQAANDETSVRYVSEIRATNGVNLVMCIYLLLTSLVLPLTSLICMSLSFSLYGANVGVFISNPATPLLNSLSVAAMIIVYHVIAK